MKTNKRATIDSYFGIYIDGKPKSKISKEYFDKWFNKIDTDNRLFVSQEETFNQEIYERIGYIISSIWSHFGVNLNCWVFDNWNLSYYDEDECWEYYNPIGFMNNKTMAQRISYEISCPILTSSRYNTSSLKNGINYTGDCANSFPTRWIYENFENELNDIVQEWKSNNPKELIGKEQAET